MVTRETVEQIANKFEIKERVEKKEVVLNVFKDTTIYTVCNKDICDTYQSVLMYKNELVADEVLKIWNKLTINDITYFLIDSQEELEIFKEMIKFCDQPASVYCKKINKFPIIAYCIDADVTDDGAIEKEIVAYNTDELEDLLNWLINYKLEKI